MTQTRNIMVMSMAIAIASIALVPMMNEAYAYGYAAAQTKMTYCNNQANYKTMVDQPTSGGTVTTSINVPSTVCGYSFVAASIDVKDGNKTLCSFDITTSNGNEVKTDCGANYDINKSPVLMEVSLDYKNSNNQYYTVNYSQTDLRT